MSIKSLAEKILSIESRDEAAHQELASLAVELAEAVQAFLRSPADHVGELVGELVWEEKLQGVLVCVTPVARYDIWQGVTRKWNWTNDSHRAVTTCNSLDEAKAACREDYLRRVAGMLRREAK